MRCTIPGTWKVALLGAAVTMVLTSCVHRSPFVEEQYFQAMGAPGEIVVTVDTRAPEKLPGSFSVQDSSFATLLSRIDRLSVSLYDPSGLAESDGVVQADELATYEYYGGAEGNIPAFLTNSMLLWDDAWEKIEEGKIRYYRNEWLGLDVYAPKNGLLLFASDNYMKAYETTYKNRTTRIPTALADRMAKSLFGFYVGSPKAIMEIGLAIPQSVLAQTDSMVLVIEEQEQKGMTLGGIVTMKSSKLANSLSILLKSSYISDKRRNKEPLGDLTNLFILEDDAVHINGMELSDEQYAAFSTMFGSLAALTTGEKR